MCLLSTKESESVMDRLSLCPAWVSKRNLLSLNYCGEAGNYDLCASRPRTSVFFCLQATKDVFLRTQRNLSQECFGHFGFEWTCSIQGEAQLLSFARIQFRFYSTLTKETWDLQVMNDNSLMQFSCTHLCSFTQINCGNNATNLHRSLCFLLRCFGKQKTDMLVCWVK